MKTGRNCISRLSQYRNALIRLKQLGFQKIFSDYLAESVGVTSAQVRKDFSIFGISGNKRGGYQIDSLISSLNELLGKSKVNNVIICGAGHLGSALMKYRNFENEGIKIAAVFDIDPAKQNRKSTVPVLPLAEMEAFIRDNTVTIALLCVPEVAAQQTFDQLVKAGIKGVLNFAPIQLKAPESIFVNDVNLAVELESLIYFVNAGTRAMPGKA